MKPLLLLSLLLLPTLGCASIFTSIEPTDDGDYIVTRHRARMIAKGEVWRCTPSGNTMTCEQLSTVR